MFEWRSVIASERGEDRLIRFQPAPNNMLDGGAAGSYKALHPFPLFSRPPDAARDVDLQPIDSCDALVGEDGEERFVIAMTDGRLAVTLPDPGKGGGGIGGLIPQGASFTSSYAYFVGTGVTGKTAGSYEVRVPGASSGAFRMSMEREDDTFTLDHPTGHKVFISPTEIVIQMQGGGKLSIDAATTKIEGVRVVVGGSGGFPAVFDNGSLTAFFANVVAALTALGIVVAPPGAFASSTVTTRA